MEENFQHKLDVVLPRVYKPGRYVGNELNAVRKQSARIDVRFALAFPDVYEIGMSHIGMQLLYHILNGREWIAAERVFAPWVDMERAMREAELPLFTLESKQAVRTFDVLGFSLQYELQYTNVLTMLDLAGIPLFADRRTESDPVVIAGGPCAFNPEPLAEFLDAVVLGDAEESIIEIAESLRSGRRQDRSRKGIIRNLAKIPGVYVPSLYEEKRDVSGAYLGTAPLQEGVPEVVGARIVDRLKPEFYPVRPVVPFIETAHDRYSLEIMRGCTRGCRFCNAGMIYRPLRTRPVDELVAQARQVIRNTGFDELSLASLSTSDFPALTDLLVRLRRTLDADRVAISFPSLRADTFTRDMADFAQDFRRSGLTLAPEAGTQRLRDVINKNHREEDLLEAVRIAFERHWKRIKLYFMVGLPTETEEDLAGIADLVGKVVALGRKFGNREIHVSVSPFAPKPQTPFQWEAQDPVGVYREKIRFLRSSIRWKNVKLSWRDADVALIEAVMGRGDRRLGRVIHTAWEQGARFDAWTEQFDPERWRSAFAAHGIIPETYASGRDDTAPLPWDHLGKGLSREFLKKERLRSLSAETTPDCRGGGCQGCGLRDAVCRETRPKRKRSGTGMPGQEIRGYGKEMRKIPAEPVIRTFRVGFSKKAQVRYISHLDTMRMLLRTLRRAGISVALSQGFHAHPKISMGPPLPLGYTGCTEYFDLDIEAPYPHDLKALLNGHLPQGFEVFETVMIQTREKSLSQAINRASYRIDWPNPICTDSFRKSLVDLMRSNTFKITRREKAVDVRLFVISAEILDNGMSLWVKTGPSGTVRPEEVLTAIRPAYEPFPDPIFIERTGLFIEQYGRRMTPIEAVLRNNQ